MDEDAFKEKIYYFLKYLLHDCNIKINSIKRSVGEHAVHHAYYDKTITFDTAKKIAVYYINNYKVWNKKISEEVEDFIIKENDRLYGR